MVSTGWPRLWTINERNAAQPGSLKFPGALLLMTTGERIPSWRIQGGFSVQPESSRLLLSLSSTPFQDPFPTLSPASFCSPWQTCHPLYPPPHPTSGSCLPRASPEVASPSRPRSPGLCWRVCSCSCSSLCPSRPCTSLGFPFLSAHLLTRCAHLACVCGPHLRHQARASCLGLWPTGASHLSLPPRPRGSQLHPGAPGCSAGSSRLPSPVCPSG